MNIPEDKNNIYTKSNSHNNCKQQWSAVLTTLEEGYTCGLTYKKHAFLPHYGKGTYEVFNFDGLFINIIDVALSKNLNITDLEVSNSLEMSFLIEGEQLIKLNDRHTHFTYESQECYLIHLAKNTLDLSFLKKKHFKEIRIRMNSDFVLKHSLNEAFDIKKDYGLQNTKLNYTTTICTKTQKLLSELINDQKKGLLKRLFLESKVLELLAIQIETKDKPSTKNGGTSEKKILKKIYEIETIIGSNLSEQLTIQELARKVGLNDSILKKEFKRVFGKTIFEYAQVSRINEAKKLLHFSDKPIYEISELVGYKNATHFSAAFKKLEGTTPKKYRTNKIT